MATNLEIKFFSIEEDAELKKRPAIEYEQIMKDAKEFVEQAEIDDKLDELETRLKSENADITKRIEAKLALLGEFKAKKQQEEGSGESTGIVDTAVDKVKDEFKKKLEKVPVVGGLLVDIFGWTEDAKKIPEDAGFFDKLWTKMLGGIGVGILSIFGYKKFKGEIDGVIEEAKEKASSVLGGGIDLVKGALGLGEGEEEDGEKKDDEKPEELAPELVPERGVIKKRDVFFKTGGKILVGLNFSNLLEDKVKNENLVSNSLSSIKSLTLEELSNLGEDKEEVIGFLKAKNSEPDTISDNFLSTFLQVREAIISEDTKKVLKYSLEEKRIIYLIENRQNLWEYFGEDEESGKDRLNKIKQEITDNPNDFLNSLTIEELCIFYLQTMPIIPLLSLEDINFGSLKDDLKGFIDGGFDEFFEDAIVPASLIKSFALAYPNSDSVSLGGPNIINNEEDENVKEEVSKKIDEDTNLDDKQRVYDKEVLEKVINFKNLILKDDFLNKLGFDNEGKQKELFLQNLDYRRVIALYGVLGGETKLDNINPINLPILAYTVGNIIGDEREKSAYITSFLKNIFMGENGDLVNDESKEVMEIYRNKLIYMYIEANTKWYLTRTGILKSTTGLKPEEMLAISGAVSLTSLVAGGRLIRTGLAGGKLSMFGLFLKKLGWIGLALTALGAGMEVLTQRNNDFQVGKFFDTLEEKAEKEGASGVIEAFEKLKDSTKVYDMPDGKKLTIIGYNDETRTDLTENTAFAIYDGKIRDITLIYDRDTLGSILDTVTFGFLENKGVIEINGKEVDFTKRRMEGSVIIFGEGDSEYRFNLDEVFSDSPNLSESVIPDDLLNTNWWKVNGIIGAIKGPVKIPPEKKYINLKGISNGVSISLVEIGPLQQ